MLAYLVFTGIGVWGNNQPVGWAWDITNFVFWIGIGHAGTLISAILFLFRQKWRTSINRVGGSDDAVRRGLRRHLSRCSTPGVRGARLLAASAAESRICDLAELPQPAGLGRVRGIDLRHGFARCSGMSA